MFYVYDKSAERVKGSSICGLELTDSKSGEHIPVKNLTKPIRIAIPRTKVDMEAFKEGELKTSTFSHHEFNVSKEDSSIMLQIIPEYSNVEVELFIKKGSKATLTDHDFNATLPQGGRKSFHNASTAVYSYLLENSALNESADGTYFVALRYKVPLNQSLSGNNTIKTGTITYMINFFEASCLFWNPVTEKWTSEGCRVSDWV